MTQTRLIIIDILISENPFYLRYPRAINKKFLILSY